MGNISNICVFGSSSERLEPAYYDMAEALGAAIALAGAGMVFGGGRIGLMGGTARGAHAQGGRIIGVIPEKLHQPGVAFPGCTQLIVTSTMHERKQTMENLADGFIALPGGFGTLEELLEVITLRQLGYHNKPIVILNQNGFYDNMLEQFEVLFATGFTHMAYRFAYTVAYTAEEAVMQVLQYEAVELPDKMRDALQGR